MVSGYLQVSQGDVQVRLEWPGKALTVTEFVEAMSAMSKAWAVVADESADVLLAASLTYEPGD